MSDQKLEKLNSNLDNVFEKVNFKNEKSAKYLNILVFINIQIIEEQNKRIELEKERLEKAKGEKIFSHYT
jgi:hypothetical protein